ncbi:MAG: hypothetical protein J6S67_04255 [Methanobrevibacter sp.]|nr:hypothetical protein [Methanobrevibacter sp.]
MSEIDIIKGVNALKSISTNLNQILDYINDNRAEALLPYTDEIHKACSMLTNIFEKQFMDMITEKERMEDDGK